MMETPARERIAAHEAGHVAVALRLGLSVFRTTIALNHRGAHRGQTETWPHPIPGDLVVLAAGIAAEELIYAGISWYGSDDNFALLNDISRCFPSEALAPARDRYVFQAKELLTERRVNALWARVRRELGQRKTLTDVDLVPIAARHGLVDRRFRAAFGSVVHAIEYRSYVAPLRDRGETETG